MISTVRRMRAARSNRGFDTNKFPSYEDVTPETPQIKSDTVPSARHLSPPSSNPLHSLSLDIRTTKKTNSNPPPPATRPSSSPTNHHRTTTWRPQTRLAYPSPSAPMQSQIRGLYTYQTSSTVLSVTQKSEPHAADPTLRNPSNWLPTTCARWPPCATLPPAEGATDRERTTSSCILTQPPSALTLRE